MNIVENVTIVVSKTTLRADQKTKNENLKANTHRILHPHPLVLLFLELRLIETIFSQKNVTTRLLRKNLL